MEEKIKLTFLGTSDALIEKGRNCSSTMLTVDGNNYFIDGGAPVAEYLVQHDIPLTTVRALFNTHFHSDHILGSLNLMSQINGCRRGEMDVYVPEESAASAIKNLLSLCDCKFNETRFRLRSYDEHFVFDDGVIRLTVYPNWHMDGDNRPSYAFLIETQKKRILFSGDMCECCELPDILFEQPLDLLVTECAHFTVDVLAEKLKDPRCQARKVAVNHVNYLDTKIPQLLALKNELSVPLDIVCDGDIISI